MRSLFILAFSPALFLLLYDVLFYYIPLSSGKYGAIEGEVLFVMIASDILAAVCLFFVGVRLLVSGNAKETFEYSSRGVGVGIYLCLCVFVFFIFNYLVYSVFGAVNYSAVLDNFSGFYALTKRGTAWLFIFLYAVIFMMLYDIYISGVNLLKSLCFFFVLALVAMTGGRSFIVVAALFYFYIRVVIWHARFGFGRALFVLLFSGIVFLGGAILRAGSLDSYAEGSVSLDFDAAFILNDSIVHAEEHGFSYLLSLEDFYNTFVPRYFNEDKPMSTAETRLVYPEVADRGTNYTFGIYANSFLNLGYVGFVAVPVYVFFASALFYYFSVSRVRGFFSFVVLFYLFYSLQFVRGGMINSRLLFIFISILIAGAMYFLFTRVRFFGGRCERLS